jgi:hypothetical protein
MANIMAEMNRLTALVASLAAPKVGGGGGGTGGGDGGAKSGRRKHQYGKDKDGNALPKCPHCNKLATHKADDCFSLPKNEEKMKVAGFADGKFTKKKEE